jgi:subtilase family serine protease
LTEADLDIEWSGAVARNAQIIYVNAPVSSTTGGVWDAWYYAVDNLIAPVISLSYGSCEFFDNNVLDATGQPLSDEVELMKANSEGITFLNSTGDAGAAECDGPTNSQTTPANLAVGGLAAAYPASSPEVTGVGGTAVTYPAGFSATYWGTANGPDGGSAQNAPLPETSWNDDEELILLQSGTDAAYWQEHYAIVSTGGGPSNCAEQSADNSNCVAGFGQPSWQTVTLSGQSGARFSPDVSLAASPNFPGYIFCTPQNAWISGSSTTSSTCVSGIAGALALNDTSGNPAPSLVGGTSASTPVMAGIVVLLNQYLGASGLGNINPTLYSLAATPSNLAFHPVTTGDNNVFCEVGQPLAPWPVAMQCPAAGVFGYSASTSDALTGYNLVTGLGSVDVANLAVAWADSTAAIDFTITPTVATFQVSQGGNINATVNVELASGFTGPITFTCTDPAPLSVCTVPPNTNASGQVSFAITTTAATTELRRPSDRAPQIFYALLLPGLLGLVFAPGLRRRSWRGIRFMGLIVVLGCSTLWLASCGGGNSSSSGNSNPGTPMGSYAITVTGTAGSEIATSSFQLTVQ